MADSVTYASNSGPEPALDVGRGLGAEPDWMTSAT